MDKFHNKLRTSILMKSLHDLLIHRRSIRKYTQEALSPEAVKTILEAGLLAPSSKRCTPWEFIAVEDNETLARLSECKTSGAKPIAGAALAIVVTADMTLTDTWIEDASIAAILMQLQAADLGLGSCWIQVRGRLWTNLPKILCGRHWESPKRWECSAFSPLDIKTKSASLSTKKK